MDIHVEDIEHLYNTPSNNNNNNNKKVIETIPRNVVKQPQIQKLQQMPEMQQIQQTQQTPINQSIPKQYAKIARPIQPAPRPQVSYDDILSNMGMFVVDGKLYMKGNNYVPPPPPPTSTSKLNVPEIPQNSYIYNKYFKDSLEQENEQRRPQTLVEYRNMLVSDIVQRARIRQIKSKKLIMPNSNINVAGGQSDLNKLFQFSQR